MFSRPPLPVVPPWGDGLHVGGGAVCIDIFNGDFFHGAFIQR